MIGAGEKAGGKAGRLLARILPEGSGGSLFFFFPFFHIGGAERVHADIVSCFAAEKPTMFFLKRSRDEMLRPDFERCGTVVDGSRMLKYTYPFSAGILAGMINRRPGACVFGCNSLFFYRMLPLLAPHVRKVDLLHAFGGGAEEFSLPVAHLLDARVVITPKTREDLAGQYAGRALDPALLERVALIPNRVEVPAAPPAKSLEGPLEVLYVGRGSEEKRVHLVARAAEICRRRGLPVRFRLVGPSPVAVAAADRDACDFLGETGDRSVLAALYDRADLLLVTSSREGFPLVIMEAMARGVVPVTTAVGGIPAHIADGGNGFLIGDPQDEAQVVARIVEVIASLSADRERLLSLAEAAYDYARSTFGGDGFCRSYRTLLLGEGRVDAQG